MTTEELFKLIGSHDDLGIEFMNQRGEYIPVSSENMDKKIRVLTITIDEDE